MYLIITLPIIILTRHVATGEVDPPTLSRWLRIGVPVGVGQG